MSAGAFERGAELPCADCADLVAPIVRPTAITPPESYCAALDCPVDIACLRNLEAAIDLAVAYLADRLVLCHGNDCDELLDALPEHLTDELAETFADALVSHGSIRRQLAVRMAARQKTAA